MIGDDDLTMPAVALETPDDDLPPTQPETPPAKKRRGFAVMDRAAVSAIASRGGKAAHAKGVAHQFNSDEAREAGRKGGMAPHKSRGKQRTA